MRKIFIFLVIFTAFYLAEAWGKEFKTAQPGYAYHFPADHGSHKDFQIEWWYFTGHLIDHRGKKSGFELTFFRTGIRKDSVRQNPSNWRVEDIYSAHFAISDESGKEFWFREKMSRNALGKAGTEQDHFQVWIDQWTGSEREGIFYLSASDGTGRNQKGIELQLFPEKPVVIHGRNGVSPKDREFKNQSHYYSLTRLKTRGRFVWNGETREVDGMSWMDHEFGSNPLLPSQTGWNWFSVQLNNRTELMLYQIRDRQGSSPFSFGTLIHADGSVESLDRGDFIVKPTGSWKSSGGAVYPMGWNITLPGRNFSMEIAPSLQNQELSVFGGKMRYWEGSVTITGAPSSGVGYVELTGYASDLDIGFSQ